MKYHVYVLLNIIMLILISDSGSQSVHIFENISLEIKGRSF